MWQRPQYTGLIYMGHTGLCELKYPIFNTNQLRCSLRSDAIDGRADSQTELKCLQGT